MKKRKPILGGIFGVASFLLALTYSAPVFASSSLRIGVDTVLTASVTVGDATISPDDAGTMVESQINVQIVSNNQTGFSAYVGTSDTTTNGVLTRSDDSETIPSITSSVAVASFPVNHWGISKDSGATYDPVKANGDSTAFLTTSSVYSSGSTNLYLGAKLNQGVSSGSYSTEIVISIVGNPVPLTLYDIEYMQEMTSDVCDNTETPNATDASEIPQFQLIDNRDNKTYWVAKLSDGNCWMTQNLDLDLSATTPLTSTNSDLNTISTFTSTRDTLLTFSDGWSSYQVGDDWVSDDTASYDPGNYYSDGDAREQIATTCNSSVSYDLNCHYHEGNYYMWGAATAGTIADSSLSDYDEAPNSICPKGWRLPKGGSSNTGSKSWTNLMTQLALGQGSSSYSSSLNIASAPFYGVTMNNGGSSNISYGYYWSSTKASSDSYAYILTTWNTYSVSTGGDNSTRVGITVRCVNR